MSGVAGHRLAKHKASHVAQIILTELEKQSFTRADLARLLGRSPQYVTDVLKGKKQMDAYLAVQLEYILKRPALDFLAADLEDERGRPRVQAQMQIIDAGFAEREAEQARRDLLRSLHKWRRHGGPLGKLSESQLRELARIIRE